MDEQEMWNIMRASVALVCQELTDEELIALNLVATLDGSPQGRIFDYKKVSPLFTEWGGTRMHGETKRALAAVVNRRLGL